MEEDKIPEGVLNKEAYNDYLEMVNALNKSERVYKTSIQNLFIDLTAPLPTVRELSKDLPDLEKEYIENQVHKYAILKGLIVQKKREAFSTKSNKEDKNPNDVLKIRQTELLEYFGRFFKVTEVLKIIQLDWGYSITRSKLETFVKNNSEKITELQEQFKKDYSDIRLGYKRSRLDELSFLYQSIKNKYLSDELREDAKVMQSLLESIKKECDGDMVVNINGKIEIEQNITFQVQNELMKEFNITALIINKMAGRLGINPNFIQSRLINSHYAKFTGFKKVGEGEDRLTDEIYSPSGITYNLDDIENKNIEVTREENKLKVIQPIQEEQQVEILSIREILKRKIEEEQNNLNKSKSKFLSNE